MNLKKTPFVLIAFLVIIASCKQNSVELAFTNADGEVPQLGNLVFRFSKSLVGDSLLNAWDSTEYISFEPKIPGRFRWAATDQLVFSPAEPLLPATNYKAKVKSEVLRYSKYDKVGGGDDISFNTPALTLDNAQAIWILQDETSKTIVPQVDLFFNYRINPEELKKKLSIEIDGQKADFSLQTLSADNKISLRLTGMKAEDKDYETKISIDKGLIPENGRNSTPESIQQKILILSPFNLVIQNVESEYDGTEGLIRVTANQQVTNESLRSHVKFDPDVKYSAEASETGIIIRSEKFDVDKSYALTFLKGLRGRIGGVLKEDATHQIAFGELEADITFTNNKAVYLSKRGAQNMEVRITSVPKVKLVISKIYESNLLMAQRYGYYPQETRSASYASYEDDYYYYDDGDATLGDVIYEKEIDTRSLPKSGGGRLLNMAQFEDRLPDFKGIYHILIRSTEDYWVRDSRYISLSDIGLIAKEGQEKIFVFANSIKTAEGMAGVNVMLYSNNNQLLGTGATNADGIAEINYIKKVPIDIGISGFKPAMIIAKTADDFNYLPFNTTRVNTSRFEVGGKRNNATGMDAFVYAERDIYRPGEKVNFSVILRNREWKSPGEIPLKMKFLLPNGKELKSFRRNLNEEGSLEGSIDISESAITGSYTLEVYSSNDVLIAAKDFSIEEFVPDRIRVNTSLDKKFLRINETTSLSITAMNFFGPPAANRNYETEIQVKPKRFAPEKFRDFDFSITNKTAAFDKLVNQGKTDDLGNASQSFTASSNYADDGVLEAKFYTTVFDETGRPVSRAASLDIFTQDVFYGIKYDGWYYQPLNQPAKFIFAAVNKDGNAVNAKAEVHVIKHEYSTVLTRSGSYFRYESQKTEKLMTENEINVGANTTFTYVPRSPGDYEIRVYRPGANTYVSTSFYSYGSWGWSSNAFEVNTEGHVDIELDKESYLAGEKVKALFKTPFSGRLLVTMETDKVISSQYVNVDKRTASVDLPLTSEHVPNVYITATLIKPHEVSDMPLTVAHGFQNVKVEEKGRKMNVEIIAQKSVRSKTHQKVTVKAAAGSYVTLAAVDNGVLQVTDFKTPDPYNYFYQKKALQVYAYDLYPLLFPEIRTRLSSTGGDAELAMEKRTNPMPAKRVKIVSYWSGIAKANGSGEADFEFDIPQFSGEVRLMAVAYKNQSFGSSENTMTVADPIVISTALPRFLSPGDTVTIPVTLSNTTAKTSSASAVIKADGPLKVIGDASQSVNLNANSEGRTVFRVAADPVMAVGKIKIEVSAMGEKFTDETELSVRPPSTLQKVNGSGSIVGNNSQKINIGLSDPIAIGFIPSSVDYELVVSRSPVVELANHLSWLVQYPYGCTEQTVSAAFPQLYFGDLADMMGLNAQTSRNANTNVLEAIRKIKMRQTYRGGIMLWDSGEEHWWSTIYAAHFLIEARKAGFDVDNSLLETMLTYISGKLKNKETISYYFNRNQDKKIAPKEVAYGLYVLALANRSDVSTMNYYKANQDLLALDSRYLLSAAYAVAGDKRSFTSMLPASFSGEESVPQTGGSFYSDVRDEAIALNALLEVDPGNAQVGVMAKHVSDKLKSRQWLSTQERAFAFLALGKIARGANQSDVSAEIKVNGKTVAKVEGGRWKGDKNVLKGTNVEIVTKGNGRLYYFWQAEGISSTGAYKEEDSYLKVRRRFYDRYGNPLGGNTFRQNDLIIVGITVEKNYSTSIENVVLTDLIPAGFEIENPRTKEIPGMDWIKDGLNPTALDVRDDRIHFFVDVRNQRQTYYYAVRAVSLGNYKMGPVSADAMYNAEYHSYHGAGVIRVVE